MNDDTFYMVVRLMQACGAGACIISGLELHALLRSGLIDAVWRTPLLKQWWGWRRALMAPRIMHMLPVVQVTLGTVLLLASMLPNRTDTMGAVATVGLMICVWLTALRVRGTMNGGSDGMLFTVLLGLTVATWPHASPTLAAGGVLYVAAQLIMSYVRAGLAKATVREWWTGEALRAFLSIPAYGVPRWVPREGALLRAASIVLIGFELAAPVALVSARAAFIYAAVAWCFHLATAGVFGLNRFLLVWSAALPSLWFAVHRLHGQ